MIHHETLKHSPFNATISALNAETSVLGTATSVRSFRRYRHRVSGNIGDCGVGIIPQLCNKVTNHGEIAILVLFPNLRTSIWLHFIFSIYLLVSGISIFPSLPQHIHMFKQVTMEFGLHTLNIVPTAHLFYFHFPFTC